MDIYQKFYNSFIATHAKLKSEYERLKKEKDKKLFIARAMAMVMHYVKIKKETYYASLNDKNKINLEDFQILSMDYFNDNEEEIIASMPEICERVIHESISAYGKKKSNKEKHFYQEFVNVMPEILEILENNAMSDKSKELAKTVSYQNAKKFYAGNPFGTSINHLEYQDIISVSVYKLIYISVINQMRKKKAQVNGDKVTMFDGIEFLPKDFPSIDEIKSLIDNYASEEAIESFKKNSKNIDMLASPEDTVYVGAQYLFTPENIEKFNKIITFGGYSLIERTLKISIEETKTDKEKTKKFVVSCDKMAIDELINKFSKIEHIYNRVSKYDEVSLPGNSKVSKYTFADERHIREFIVDNFDSLNDKELVYLLASMKRMNFDSKNEIKKEPVRLTTSYLDSRLKDLLAKYSDNTSLLESGEFKNVYAEVKKLMTSLDKNHSKEDYYKLYSHLLKINAQVGSYRAKNIMFDSKNDGKRIKYEFSNELLDILGSYINDSNRTVIKMQNEEFLKQKKNASKVRDDVLSNSFAIYSENPELFGYKMSKENLLNHYIDDIMQLGNKAFVDDWMSALTEEYKQDILSNELISGSDKKAIENGDQKELAIGIIKGFSVKYLDNLDLVSAKNELIKNVADAVFDRQFDVMLNEIIRNNQVDKLKDIILLKNQYMANFANDLSDKQKANMKILDSFEKNPLPQKIYDMRSIYLIIKSVAYEKKNISDICTAFDQIKDVTDIGGDLLDSIANNLSETRLDGFEELIDNYLKDMHKKFGTVDRDKLRTHIKNNDALDELGSPFVSETGSLERILLPENSRAIMEIYNLGCVDAVKKLFTFKLLKDKAGKVKPVIECNLATLDKIKANYNKMQMYLNCVNHEDITEIPMDNFIWNLCNNAEVSVDKLKQYQVRNVSKLSHAENMYLANQIKIKEYKKLSFSKDYNVMDGEKLFTSLKEAYLKLVKDDNWYVKNSSEFNKTRESLVKVLKMFDKYEMPENGEIDERILSELEILKKHISSYRKNKVKESKTSPRAMGRLVATNEISDIIKEISDYSKCERMQYAVQIDMGKNEITYIEKNKHYTVKI